MLKKYKIAKHLIICRNLININCEKNVKIATNLHCNCDNNKYLPKYEDEKTKHKKNKFNN